MNRFRRCSLAVSVLACIGTCVLWVRGFRHVDTLYGFSPGGHLQAVASYRGALCAIFTDAPGGEGVAWTGGWATPRAESVRETVDDVFDSAKDSTTSIGGFAVAHGTLPLGTRAPAYRAVRVPAWFAVLVTLLPIVAAIRAAWRRRRWARAGRCRACGYDLRGAVTTEGPCPECGTARVAAPPDAQDPTPKRRAAARDTYVLAMLTVLAVLLFAIAATLRELAAQRAGVRTFTAEEVAAGMHLRFDVTVESPPPGSAVDMLVAQTGRRVEYGDDVWQEMWTHRSPRRTRRFERKTIPEIIGELTSSASVTVRPHGDGIRLVSPTTAEHEDRDRLVVRAYDMRDLSTRWWTQLPGMANADEDDPDDDGTLHLVSANLSVGPGPFTDAAWSFGSGGWAFVADTPEGHRELAWWIASMRRALRGGGGSVSREP